MKITSCVALSLLVAVSASAGDSQERLRERLMVCKQFVIEETGISAIPSETRYCCGASIRFRNCDAEGWAKKFL